MKKSTKALMIIGAVLIFLSVCAFIVTHIYQKNFANEAYRIVGEIKAVMPEAKSTAFENKANEVMPTAEIRGEDFCAVINLPAHNISLPICSSWNNFKTAKYPCRYSGSMYDNSLIIGGVDTKGQFDFQKLISITDSVYITDMEGNTYGYKISDIIKTHDVSAENLSSLNADLVIFVKNTYSFNYTVLHCMLDEQN